MSHTTAPIAYRKSMYLPYSHHARKAVRRFVMGQTSSGTTIESVNRLAMSDSNLTGGNCAR